MPIPLELGQVSDPYARRALEQVSLHSGQAAPGAPGPAGPPAPRADRGAAGPAGPAGPVTFLAGSGAPGAGTGVDGAMYLDITNGRFYGPKASGAWPGTPLGILMRD